jgi:hypothetical protein
VAQIRGNSLCKSEGRQIWGNPLFAPIRINNPRNNRMRKKDAFREYAMSKRNINW